MLIRAKVLAFTSYITKNNMKVGTIMEDKDYYYYRKIMSDQKGFHDQQVKMNLLSEMGVRELGPDYATLDRNDHRSKLNYCNEMWNYHKKGARITLNGRELQSAEFSGAAELLAKGILKKEILLGQYIHNTEYKLYSSYLR